MRRIRGRTSAGFLPDLMAFARISMDFYGVLKEKVPQPYLTVV